jgi:hypothetical protein
MLACAGLLVFRRVQKEVFVGVGGEVENYRKRRCHFESGKKNQLSRCLRLVREGATDLL